MKIFYQDLAKRLEGGERLAVASIARRLGSAPRDQGTRCAVLPDGRILGTIGGGLLEARTQEESVVALGGGTIRYLKMRLDAKELAAGGMICGGSVDILIAPWGAAEAQVAHALLEAFEGNRRAALLTSWGADGRTLAVGLLDGQRWIGSGDLDPAGREAAAEALSAGKPVLRGKAEGPGLLAEPIEREKAPLIVMGAGHVGKALTEVAALAGFSVAVVDDRPEFADPALLPRADRVLCRPFEGAIAELGADDTTAVVICTRGHLGDTDCALDALRSPACYVGMIGSRRKRGMVVKGILAQGIPEERLGVLHTPVGLSIGAETPEEIAVSIVAELIALRRGALPPAG